MEIPVNPEREAELAGVVREWDLAMVANDADAIGRYMAEDWIIIGADGTESDKATFLALVKSGVLTHDVMESEDLRIRIYGDTAVLSARGVSRAPTWTRDSGRWSGRPACSSGNGESGAAS